MISLSYIDITVPMREGMLHHPLVPPVEIKKVFSLKEGAGGNLSKYCFGSHIGTHFDPPYHQIIDGKKGDELPADYFIGKTKVFSFMSGEDIDLKDVKDLDIEKGDMVLFKTPSSQYILGDIFIKDYVTITTVAAENLVEKGIHALGIDYISIDKFGSNDDSHKIFLKAGVPIIESLYLGKVEPGTYKMTAMFMAIKDSDGGPIRAVLEKY